MKITKSRLKRIIKEELTKILREDWDLDPQELAWQEEEREHHAGEYHGHAADPVGDDAGLLAKFVGDDDPNVWDIMHIDENLEIEDNVNFILSLVQALSQRTKLSGPTIMGLGSIAIKLEHELQNKSHMWQKLFKALKNHGVGKY